MKTNPNSKVSPVYIGHQIKATESGLTKREYFAALALQAYIGSQTALTVYVREALEKRAVERADALIAALNETESEQDVSAKQLDK